MNRKRKKDWLKSKGYIHLTNRVNVRDERGRIHNLVKTPALVSKHAFFPLLNKTIPQRRYKIIGYDEDHKPIRGHKKLKRGKVTSTKKNRPINYATHIDAQIYAYYSNEVLKDFYEKVLTDGTDLSDSIIAYRRIEVEGKKTGKNNIHFAKEVFDFIKEKDSCVALAFDIDNFFTTLNHKHLKKAWCSLLGTKSLPPDHYNIFKSITKFSYVKRDDFRLKNKSFDEKKLAENRAKGVQAFFESPLELREAINNGDLAVYKNQFKDKKGNLCGIPQGLAISAMLANIYLLEFDKTINSKISELGGLYRRYSDDIAIICNQKNRTEIEELVETELKEYKLKMSKGKTEICNFDKDKDGRLRSTGIKKINGSYVEIKNLPFRYLGFEFNGKQVLIKSKNLSKFYRRMKYAVKAKARRIKKINEKGLPGDTPLFKRKLYRSFTNSGRKKRKFLATYYNLEYNSDLRKYEFKKDKRQKKYWGNFIGYAYRASKIMNEPGILRQLRNHRKILNKVIEKEMSNIV